MRKRLFSTLVVLPLIPVMACAALKDAAKIAVASDGKETTASISNTARASYYLMFNEKGELIEAIANPYRDSKQDHVSLAAEFLSKEGVMQVIADSFSNKMITALGNSNMTYCEYEGIVDNAVRLVINPGNKILEDLDRNLNPESYESYRKLINIEPDGRKREFILFVVKKGSDKVGLLFLSPASEKGRSMLRLGDNMWLYIPNVGKPIRITSLQSAVGGVFNNADILRLDYAKEYNVQQMAESDEECVLHLKAKTRTVAYDKLKMWVDKNKVLPTKIECLTEASMLIKTIYFKQTKDFGGGILRPSVIETDSPLYKGYKSVIIFAKIEGRTFADEVFTLTFMPNLETLRQ
ncbi:MAG: outer membrane lipoprotein-sorting protein [Planctomycetota bacterium]